MTPDKVNITDKFEAFSERWSPKIIANVDDYDVRIARIEGDFVWHQHDDADEMFMVVEGEFDMEFRDKTVHLTKGEVIVVPRGTEHRPCAPKECKILMIEKSGTPNTGSTETDQYTTTTGESI